MTRYVDKDRNVQRLAYLNVASPRRQKVYVKATAKFNYRQIKTETHKTDVWGKDFQNEGEAILYLVSTVTRLQVRQPGFDSWYG